MRKLLLFLTATIFFPLIAIAQQLSGSELLQKAIAYHDPENQWNAFKGEFIVVMESPNRPVRKSKISLDLPRSYFRLNVNRASTKLTYLLEGDNCSLLLNGSKDYTTEEAEAKQLNCERANLMKDYYTYLYGLPMKLKDPGTQLDPVIQKKKFKNKNYLVLKVTYDQEVGEDTWYFYFNPETYAMEVYQFFHDESKNDGEYILLEGEELIQGIRMPKVRAWYYNKDNGYLGTDTLNTN
ncbi:DUF6503 family protein [Flavobacteriaceae bacterium D16]|nr:DUF6503 family protein [Flavobacteriaceae bacterium D16]